MSRLRLIAVAATVAIVATVVASPPAQASPPTPTLFGVSVCTAADPFSVEGHVSGFPVDASFGIALTFLGLHEATTTLFNTDGSGNGVVGTVVGATIFDGSVTIWRNLDGNTVQSPGEPTILMGEVSVSKPCTGGTFVPSPLPTPPPPTIVAVALKACRTLHIVYNHFPTGVVVRWRLNQTGTGTLASGSFTTVAGGKEFHFVNFDVGLLKPDSVASHTHVRMTWTIAGTRTEYVANRDPGC